MTVKLRYHVTLALAYLAEPTPARSAEGNTVVTESCVTLYTLIARFKAISCFTYVDFAR